MIYLDHASTTYVYPEVIDVVKNTMEQNWGNPSNLYQFGVESRKILDRARRTLATNLGCEPGEIIFTSGASEGNAWVVNLSNGDPFCSGYEHHNLYANPRCRIIDEAFLDLAIRGAKDTDENGDPMGVNKSYYEGRICSHMYVNNETGEIFPIERLCEKAHLLGMYFHSDMTQALGNVPINLHNLGVDFATFSGHKIHAPKGVGFIYINSHTFKEPHPMIYGGGQEFGLRAGTENVPYIEGLRLAVANSCARRDLKSTHCHGLKKQAMTLLESLFDNEDFKVVTPGNSVDNIFTFCLRGVSSEIIMMELNEKEIYIGTGSACTSGDMEPSNTLMSMGVDQEFLNGEIRLSFDLKNTKQDVKTAMEEISKVYKELKNG